MALSSIELCSSALIKLGADGISSFEDASAEARVAARLYPIARDALLCAHPWSFATAQSQARPPGDRADHRLRSRLSAADRFSQERCRPATRCAGAASPTRSSAARCTATPRRSC